MTQNKYYVIAHHEGSDIEVIPTIDVTPQAAGAAVLRMMAREVDGEFIAIYCDAVVDVETDIVYTDVECLEKDGDWE